MAPHPIDQDFIGTSDLQQILSDALASFSPLATLVGSDSARSLTHNTTNMKQACVASMAPIGALGMMASVCKGSKLTGLKAMLGAGDTDIYDSCADLGCGTLQGVIPRMNGQGTLSSKMKEFNAGIAACGILRAKCDIGSKEHTIDTETLSDFLEEIGSSTCSGRFSWKAKDESQQAKLVNDVLDLLYRSFINNRWDPLLLETFASEESLKGGKGAVELHWPAPAMQMETNGWIIYAYGLGYGSITLSIVLITTFLLHWQSIAACFTLLGGQALLVLGHMLAQWSVKHQRTTVHVNLLRKQFAGTWMLVDNVWFASQVAKRPIGRARTLSSDHIQIGQYLNMKQRSIPTLHVFITLAAIVIGFIGFYIGAKSSNVYTVLIYIVLFFLVNTTKGSVIEYANKAYVTPLNNFGYLDVVKRPKPVDPRSKWKKFKSLFKRKHTSIEALDLDEEDASVEWKDSEEKPTVTKQLADSDAKRKGKEVEYDEPALIEDVHEKDEKPKPLPRSSLNGTFIDSDAPLHEEPEEDLILDAELLMIGLPSPSPSLDVGLPIDLRQSSSLDTRCLEKAPIDPQLNSTNDDSPNSGTSDRQIDQHALRRKHIQSTVVDEEEPQASSSAKRRAMKSRTKSSILPGNDIDYHVYVKIALRSSQAIGMFYFSQPQIWGMASHVIHNAVQNHVTWRSYTNEREAALHLPFWYQEEDTLPSKYGVPKLVSARLVLAIDETRYEDLYWSAGQEVVSILMGNFTSTTELPSESPKVSNVSILGTYVFFVVRLFMMVRGLSEAQYRAYPGVLSLMRAIDLVKIKYPFDDSSPALSSLVFHAQAAVNSVLDSHLKVTQGEDSQGIPTESGVSRL